MTFPGRTRGAALGPRLQALLDLVPSVETLVDVGCDHAEVACRSVQTGRARRAIGVELSREALAAGARTVARLGLQAQVDLRSGDGFAPISTDDRAKAAVLAGMGGRTMLQICARRDPRALGIRRLALQPNRDEDQVRAQLGAAGWGLVAERLPIVGGRAFPTLLFDAEAAPERLTPLELLLGPHLLRDRPPGLGQRAAQWHAHLARKPSGEVDAVLVAELAQWADPD